MENLKEITNNYITLVDEQISSIFSKEDLKALLIKFSNEIETNSKPPIPSYDKDKIITNVTQKFEQSLEQADLSELLDLDNAEFSLDHYNKVQLESVPFQIEQISEMLPDILDEILPDSK